MHPSTSVDTLLDTLAELRRHWRDGGDGTTVGTGGLLAAAADLLVDAQRRYTGRAANHIADQSSQLANCHCPAAKAVIFFTRPRWNLLQHNHEAIRQADETRLPRVNGWLVSYGERL